MASYDLVCEKCGHAFEVFRQGFLKDDDRVCPECGSEDVRQKFSSFLHNFGGAGAGCALRAAAPSPEADHPRRGRAARNDDEEGGAPCECPALFASHPLAPRTARRAHEAEVRARRRVPEAIDCGSVAPGKGARAWFKDTWTYWFPETPEARVKIPKNLGVRIQVKSMNAGGMTIWVDNKK